jgi:hypothetical protein
LGVQEKAVDSDGEYEPEDDEGEDDNDVFGEGEDDSADLNEDEPDDLEDTPEEAAPEVSDDAEATLEVGHKTEATPDEGGKSDADHIERFEYQIRQIVKFMADWCKEQPVMEFLSRDPEETPIDRSAFVLLLKSDPAVLADRLLSCIPRKVKAILGRADLSMDHLELLPKLPRKYGKAGCYLGLPVKELCGDEAQDGARYCLDSFRGKPCEVGAYVGSSARKNGMGEREAEHERHITRTLDGRLSKSPDSFYGFAGRPGVETTFFLLARMDPAELSTKPESLSLEGIFHTYLRLVQPTSVNRKWHNFSVAPFIDAVRASVPGLPDFSQHGLNRAWSIKQGGLWYAAPKKCVYPGCDKDHRRFTATSGDYLGGRLCSVHGQKRIRESEKFLAGGPCIWCEKPRGYGKANFTGNGATSICSSCDSLICKLKQKGTPALADAVKEHTSRRRGCAHCLRGEWSGAPMTLHFFGVGLERRCDACYFYRAGHDGVERPDEEWYVAPSRGVSPDR